MVKSVFAVILACVILTQAFAQENVQTSPKAIAATASEATIREPKLPEQQATKLQLAASQLQIIQYRYLQAKADFEKIQADSTAEFQKLSADLTAQIEAAYKAAGVTKEQFKLDPVTATWSPVEKAKK